MICPYVCIYIYIYIYKGDKGVLNDGVPEKRSSDKKSTSYIVSTIKCPLPLQLNFKGQKLISKVSQLSRFSA